MKEIIEWTTVQAARENAAPDLPEPGEKGCVITLSPFNFKNRGTPRINLVVKQAAHQLELWGQVQ